MASRVQPDDPELKRLEYGLGARSHLELPVDAADEGPDRVRRDREQRGDLREREAPNDELEDFQLALRKGGNELRLAPGLGGALLEAQDQVLRDRRRDRRAAGEELEDRDTDPILRESFRR